jgi:magnesium chelatase family protein
LALDLAIAIALLQADRQIDFPALLGFAAMGELALDGTTRPVNGALAAAEAARDEGQLAVLVPGDNGGEAALVPEVDVFPLHSLADLRDLAAGHLPPRPEPLSLTSRRDPGLPDLADIRGQRHLRYVLEVAAAGGHSLLMVGPPGAGKALAAARLPSILPPLTRDEALEVVRIQSAAGRLDQFRGARPFRAPHHTIAPSGLIGSAEPLRLGEATIAHRGVLYLDELQGFGRDAIRALGEPLSHRTIGGRGLLGSRTLPAAFQLLAAAEPCGALEGLDGPSCSARAAEMKVRRDFLDRIDLVCLVEPPSAEEIGAPPDEPSAAVRERVIAARARQEGRLGAARRNADMSPAEAHSCGLHRSAAALLQRRLRRGRLSATALVRVERLARTVADLEGVHEVRRPHVLRALALARPRGC